MTKQFTVITRCLCGCGEPSEVYWREATSPKKAAEDLELELANPPHERQVEIVTVLRGKCVEENWK